MFRLEKLELNGFKSFSSRTEFLFGAGITAVVGPNGCGKSNIADSINWVIGGQSSRALRAEHMGDVIFNGSDARRPMGMAEVSLHLVAANGADHATVSVELEGSASRSDPETTVDSGDVTAAELPEADPMPLAEAGNGHAGGNGNGSHPAPPDPTGDAPRRSWLDRQKVVITRRLFRSGESEYLLDGQKCRLRDIQDLLAEVRIGSGLYSVIEQGRVDSVLLSRPRDRRVLIEEAAGIALYKVRKRQAQTKLEATEANLLRIHDIVSELEKQIGSLKRQAARARRYARISAEIEKGERILFHHESVRLDGQADQIAARRVEVEDHGARAAATLAKAEALVAEGREAVAEEAARHQAAREGLHALDRALDQIKAGIDRFREQETEATTHLARGAAEAASLAGRLAVARAREESLAVELDGAATESARAEGAVLDHEASARLDAAALQSAEAALAAAREEAVAGAGGLSECRNEIRRLDESAARWHAEESRLERLVAEIGEESLSLVERGREHESGREAFGVSRAGLREIIEDGARALRGAESRREALLLEREERRGRLRAIEERIVSLSGIEEADGQELEALRAGSPARFLKDILSPPEGFDRAVDAALRGLLRGCVIDSVDEAAALMAALKDRGMGRAVLIPAEARARGAGAPDPHPHSPVGGSLGTLAQLLDAGSLGIPGLAVILDRVAVAADMASGLAVREAMPGRDVVTLSGDFLSRDGWMEGGAEIPEEAGVMTLRRLLKRLGADSESTGSRVAMLDGEIEAQERMVGDLRSRAADLKHREAILEKQGETLRVEEEVLRGESARLELRRDAHAADLGRVREDLAAGAGARTAVAWTLAETLNRHDGLLREAESLAGGVDTARGALAARNAALATQRSAASAARERRASLEAESRHHAAAIADLHGRIDREREDRIRWDARLAEARSRLAEDTSVLSDRMADRVLADGLVASAEAALIEKRGALPALEEGVRRARGAHDEAREALHAVALEEERLIGERRGLEARVIERGLPSLAVAVSDLTPEDRALDPEAVRSQIAAHRERRDAMGAVNLMAVEQFRELEQRHAFITAQRRDLEDSIRSLKETIARINRQSRERFLDAFEKIRTGFADIFKILFGGGRADLRLVTDGDEDGDLLEAGLEISAQPPGKRLQSLSLLSGGEKALTAIALLFAIFRYSPSPFCLLDEVDAPLDEANVIRFNALLERMSSDTQFLMITHNRRSMEAAAMLYGITMEEPGVSRAVSVVMASEADRKEAARTLPALLASRHRGHAGRVRPAAPTAGGNGA
ncbi:MAG: chromosome segregation protein SMC [Acidobacteria bacterium]|nr:chromosome segregation protein SMC [Acidobacteriota bacterium]